MANFSKLDTKSLIKVAVMPMTSQPKQLALPYDPETVDAASRKRTRQSDQSGPSDGSLFKSSFSEETFVTKSGKKSKSKWSRSSTLMEAPMLPNANYVKEEKFVHLWPNRSTITMKAASLQLVKPTQAKPMTTSSKPLSSSRKASIAPKRQKSFGTPAPTSLEGAHPADKALK